MAGAIIFCVAMVLVVPVGVMFAGGAWSALVGWLLGEEATQRAVNADTFNSWSAHNISAARSSEAAAGL